MAQEVPKRHRSEICPPMGPPLTGGFFSTFVDWNNCPCDPGPDQTQTKKSKKSFCHLCYSEKKITDTLHGIKETCHISSTFHCLYSLIDSMFTVATDIRLGLSDLRRLLPIHPFFNCLIPSLYHTSFAFLPIKVVSGG